MRLSTHLVLLVSTMVLLLSAPAAAQPGPTIEDILSAQKDYTGVEIRSGNIIVKTQHRTRYQTSMLRYLRGKSLPYAHIDLALASEVSKALQPQTSCDERGYSCPSQFSCNVFDEVKDLGTYGSWIYYYECIPDPSSCENGCVVGYEIPADPEEQRGDHAYQCKPAEPFECSSAAPGAEAAVYYGIPGYMCAVEIK